MTKLSGVTETVEDMAVDHELLEAVVETVAVPAEYPVTFPAVSTFATDSSVLFQEVRSGMFTAAPVG